MSKIKLYQGDCLELMKNIPDKSIDMILCDLPYGVTNNKADIVIPFDKLWEQYNRISKDNACIALFAQSLFYVDLVNSKFNKDITNNNYGKFEVQVTKMTEDKYPISILKFPKPHPSVCLHRTQKPVELLEYLIKTYTNEENTVLDNCMGSGSTGVACKKLNRNFIGIELDKNYYSAASKRIKNYVVNKKLF